MDITLTTPSLLFPAISLLLLAYTNRFLALASLVRSLHAAYKLQPDELILRQIDNLRRRIELIRNMQVWGVGSLFLCTLCMFVLFKGWLIPGKWLFGVSLIFLMVSLAISVREVQMSVGALNLHLHDLEEARDESGARPGKTTDGSGRPC